MGLTDQGFVRLTYDDILNLKIKRAKELFGEDIDTSDQSVLGKFIRISAYDQAIAEEEIEAVYFARFPDTASGQSLDRLLVFTGLTRNPAEPATYSVKATGAAGHTIPAGFLVGTESGLTYYTVQEATIGEDGTCLLTVSCTQSGSLGNVVAGSIDRVVNPDASVTSVKGQERLSAGRDVESDKDLRARLKAAIAGSGSCNENALRSALLRVPTVQFAAVVTNDSDSTDSDGRPAHSFECFVLGGNDYRQEIGEAIYDKRPIGIQTVGDESVTVKDGSGADKTVKFSFAPNTAITVKVKIKTSAAYPSDGDDLVSENVTGYINGLGIGNSLVLSSLYGHIYSVQGVQEVVSLQLSTDGGTSYSTNNVTVPSYGVAVCADVIVEVES